MTLVSTQFIEVMTSLGFPAGAFILMYKFATQTLKENTSAINDLKVAIKTMCIPKSI